MHHYFILGTKFNTKTQTISLEATVNFTDGKLGNSYEDPFCVGQNSYAQVQYNHNFTEINQKTHMKIHSVWDKTHMLRYSIIIILQK